MNYFKLLAIGVSWLVLSFSVICADDLSELREAAKQCEGQGLKALVGFSCHGVKTVYGFDGADEKIVRQLKVRGSFRSTSQWYVMVWTDPAGNQGISDGVIVRNNRLGYTGNRLNTSDPIMSSHGYSAKEQEKILLGAETYFSGVTSGENFFEISFYTLTGLDGFTARRRPTEDSTDAGRCWEWSSEAQDDSPPYKGEVWIRDFGNGVQAIGRVKFRIRGSERVTDIRNTFSSNPNHPSLIERVDEGYDGGRTSFVIEKIEAENEPVDGYAPERFGLRTPVDPRSVWWWSLAGLVVFGSMAVYLTRRYWKQG